jgi:hypothetical protein
LWCHFRRASRNIQRRVLHNRALWPALAICLSAGGHNSANYVRLGGAKKLTSEQKPHRNALCASRNRSTKSLVPSKIRVACPRRLINISWDIVRAIN